MRFVLFLLLSIGLTACHAHPDAVEFPVADPDASGLDADVLHRLVALAERFVADDRIVGAEILIIKDRRTVLHETMGWSDREAGIPLARGSLYRLRSMTKPYTGTAAMMLIDQGRLQLDSRASQYLDSWDNQRSRSITVEQLLAHRSGFIQAGWPVPAASFDRLQEIVDACGEQGPRHAPGEQFIYSDVNSFALGALVTHLSGMPVERFIETKILAPLRLDETHVGYSPDAPWADRMNPTYQRDETSGAWVKYWTPAESEVFPYFRASGGLVSTTTDYARWLSCWMDWIEPGTPARPVGPPRLLSQVLVEASLTPHGADEYGAYGYHWGLHGSDPLAFGHSGSDGTMAVAVPAADLIVLYFTQSRGSDTLAEWLDAARDLWMHKVGEEAPEE